MDLIAQSLKQAIKLATHLGNSGLGLTSDRGLTYVLFIGKGGRDDRAFATYNVGEIEMKAIRYPVPEIGPMYEGWLSPGVRVGNFVFTSGLIGCNPKTGKILTTGTEAQVRQIFEAMRLVLKTHGASLDDVVKMTMYFTDRKKQWPIFDRIRREIWKQDPPATTGIGITELERGAEVEVEAIAVVPDG